jgi:hypothetical protein
MNHRHDYQAPQNRLRCAPSIAGYAIQTMPGPLTRENDCHISCIHYNKLIGHVKNKNTKLLEKIPKYQKQ